MIWGTTQNASWLLRVLPRNMLRVCRVQIRVLEACSLMSTATCARAAIQPQLCETIYKFNVNFKRAAGIPGISLGVIKIMSRPEVESNQISK